MTAPSTIRLQDRHVDFDLAYRFANRHVDFDFDMSITASALSSAAVGQVLEALRLFEVTNCPVCAASEASRHLLDGAATPPYKGEE